MQIFIFSACMKIFRAQFMRENEIAIVPEGGYERSDTASVTAIKYMDWRSIKDKVDIQHAGNGREKQRKVGLKTYKLDEWIESQNKAVEFLGW